MTANYCKFIQVFLIIIVILFVSHDVSAQDQAPTPASSVNGSQTVTEADFLAKLALINPEVVRDFQLATQAHSSGEYELARELFLHVLELAPEFSETFRRLSAVELKLGNVESAISFAEEAVSMLPSATNKAALAVALSQSHHRNENERALPLALEAARDAPSSGYVNIVLIEIAVLEENREALRIASDNLLDIAPANPLPHYFSGLVAAQNGNFENAKLALEQAETLGMPAGDIESAMLELNIEKNIEQNNQRRWISRVTSPVQTIALILLVVVVVLEFYRQKRIFMRR